VDVSAVSSGPQRPIANNVGKLPIQIGRKVAAQQDKVPGKSDQSYIKDYYITRLTGMEPGTSKEFRAERRIQGNLMRTRQGDLQI